MCLLCISIAKDNLTTYEVAKAFFEFTMNTDEEHKYELIGKIIENYTPEQVEEIAEEANRLKLRSIDDV